MVQQNDGLDTREGGYGGEGGDKKSLRTWKEQAEGHSWPPGLTLFLV